MKTFEEVKALIEQAKELQLESIEIDGIKYTLRRDPIMRPQYVAEDKTEEFYMDLPEEDPDEVLYYATPYWDFLQAQKELKQKQREESDELKASA